MNARNKNNLLSKRNIRFTVGLVIVALVAGVYFLFRPFPAGPSLEAAAKVSGVKEAASVNGWSAYANPATVVKVDDLQQSQSPVSAAVQRLDIGAGYVLETGSQGSKIVAPSAPAVASAAVQRLDIGAGYLLENSSQGSKIVAPSAPAVASAAVQRLDIGAGYLLETSSQGTKLVAPIAQASALAAQEPALVPSFVLEVSAQDGQGYVPANAADSNSAKDLALAPSFVLDVSSHEELGFVPTLSASPVSSIQRLDIGAGYMLENSSQGSRIVVPNTPLKLAATATNADYLKKIDIGSGYMLVLGTGDSWKIVPAP